MKFLLISCLFFAVLIKSYSSTNTDKETNNGTGDVPRQTGNNNGTGFMSTLKTVAGVAVGALAVQSAFLAGSASRLPSSSGDEKHQFGDDQRFVPKIPENARKMTTYKELHANPFGQNIGLAKDGQMGNVMAEKFHHQRKLTTNSAVAKGKINPKMETIDPRFYPLAPRGKVTDIYKSANGKKIIVPDPYRDLENANSSATKQFVREINQISQPYLEGSPLRQKLNQTLTKLWNYELFFTPQFHGEYYYYYRNSGLQNQRVLYQTESLAEPGKVFLDPNTLSKDGTIAVTMESFSRDGLLFAYGFSAKGSDSFTVKFKKTTGEDLPDQLDDIIYSEFDWLSDGSGVFYSNYPKQLGTEDEFKNHSLYFHKMGTDPKKDILVAQNPEHPYSLTYGQVSEDGRFLFVIVSENPNTQMFYYDLAAVHNKITGQLKLMPLFDKFDADYQIIDSDNDSALVSTNKDAPMNKLIRVSLKGGTKQTPQVVIPEDRTRLMRFVYPVDGDKLLICYMDNVKDALYVHDLKSGKKLYQIPLPFGSVIMDGSISNNDDVFAFKLSSKIFFKIESFVTPFTIFYADFAKFGDRPVQLEVFREGKVPGLDSNAFTVEQVFYASKDGTRVPMFITHRKDMVRDGTNPLFLTGYGGFDESMLPSFSVDYLMFIQHFNGVVAIPNIRGGGEYGEKWHEQGMLDKRQNVFDDFIAAAEFLISERYTNSNKLAIYGASNGGLLTAVCSQQRPELFGAVITQLGVLDMLRFNKFGIGALWEPEFGNPDDPKDFPFIYKYSPLQQLKLTPGQQWPTTLLITADHDDRVDPAHTLKYTAQLYYLLRTQAEGWQRNPVLAKVQTDQGHALSGTSTVKKINEKVDFYSFIGRVFGLQWTD
ncbi:hypothetical protein niasHS_006231 [Heterodera schachtii]|uniref:Prolyl endopeptidase n=1 Tax=Heterodera schachtii TaxID=97005 RepID=A0ABD2JT81_HETSC